MKAFGLSLGIMAMSFAFFVGNPSSAKAEKEVPHHICCKSNSSGCTDSGGGEWPTDEIRTAETCS